MPRSSSAPPRSCRVYGRGGLRARPRSGFVGLFVHSLFYSGFFEDPLTWLALALASSFLASHDTADEVATMRRLPNRPHPMRAAFGVLGVLGLLVALTVPSLGSDRVALRARRSRSRTACSDLSSAPPTRNGIPMSRAPPP